MLQWTRDELLDLSHDDARGAAFEGNAQVHDGQLCPWQEDGGCGFAACRDCATRFRANAYPQNGMFCDTKR